MERIRPSAGSPLVLLACLFGGALLGSLAPQFGEQSIVLAQVYLGVINMASLPLLVVATIFGLRQVFALPRPGARLLRIGVSVAGIIALVAVVGAACGLLAGLGQNISESDLQHLGRLVQSNEAGSGEDSLKFSGDDATRAEPLDSGGHGLVPDNFFKVLTQGQVHAILIGALVFGAAFAGQLGTGKSVLMELFEGIYRTLELIIARANMLIPVVIFVTAASFVAVSNMQTLHAMGGFLALFVGSSLALSGLAFLYIWKKSGLRLVTALAAMKTPVLISLTSSSATASIPDAIESLSARMGFSRGLTEFIIPTSAVFMRCGAALYFSLIAVFVAHLYGQEIGPMGFLLICLGSIGGAFATAGYTGVATLGYMVIALHMLQLPVEAVLPMALAIDLLCEGPRSVLNLLGNCALVALSSDGLPMDGAAAVDTQPTASNETMTFTFSRTSVAIMSVCVILTAILITIAGVGVGMR